MVDLTRFRVMPGRHRRMQSVRLLACLLVAALIGSGLSGVVAVRAGSARPVPAAATTPAAGFSSAEVGFAEGSGLADADLARRLDGMVSYLPGTDLWLRVDLDWWYVQDCRGCQLRWDRLDPVLDAAHDRGMRVLLVLAYAPPWANGGHATDKWFPTRDADWTAIVDATVRHAGDRVAAYEVWNEPNNAAFGGSDGFGNYDGDRRARYWQLVRLAAQTIRALCPGCPVLAGASGAGYPHTATSNPDESGAWLDWAYRNGYGPDFDALAHHPYPAWNSGHGPDRPECATRWWNLFGPPGESPACGELAYLRSIMIRHGDGGKQIWGTEWGYPSAGAAGIPASTVREHLVQSIHMWRTLAYTGPLFLYSYRDACTRATDPECHFGLVHRDFTPKPELYQPLRAALSGAGQPSLLSGQSLRRWVWLLSGDGRFQLVLQGDGNLVLYRRHGPARWASHTRDGFVLINQPDGNLVLYRADGTAAWSSGTAGAGPSTLWLQEDGNLVLYRDRDAFPTWATHTVASVR